MRTAAVSSSPDYRLPQDDLLLRETNHRCCNDLQLVVSLLGLQSRRVASEEARSALSDAAERVAVLARSRATIIQQRAPDLAATLRQVCEALQPYAEPRSILISFRIDQALNGLSANRITTLALVVNELVTNAIKHAFEEGANGRITVAVRRNAGGDVVVTVDDDGLPHPDQSGRIGNGLGLGLGLARRLMASIDGLLIAPISPAKKFELRVSMRDGPVLV